MAAEELDLELIAAFIDGRLTGAERDRAVKLLGESDAAFEVYADALRARSDLDAGKVLQIRPPRPYSARPWLTIGSVAAAAVLMIAILPSIQARRERADFNAPASQIASAVTQRPDLARALPADWDQRQWSVSRGGASRLVDSTMAFRMGVRATDLQVAIAAGDTARASRLTAEINESLNAVELSDAVRVDFSNVSARIAQGASKEQIAASAETAERALGTLLGSFWFDFGRWVAAGELAASTHTGVFFAQRGTETFLKSAARRGGLAPADADLLRQVALPAGRSAADADFDTIRQNFRTLIERHGG